MTLLEFWDNNIYYIMGVFLVLFLVFMFIIVPNMGEGLTNKYTYDTELAIFNKLNIDEQNKYLDMSESDKLKFISKHLNY